MASKRSTMESRSRVEGVAPSGFGVSKVIELIGESAKGWEDAMRLCVAEATETLRHVEAVELCDMSVSIRQNSIDRFKVRCKVRFDIDHAHREH
jgi:dodecin